MHEPFILPAVVIKSCHVHVLPAGGDSVLGEIVQPLSPIEASPAPSPLRFQEEEREQVLQEEEEEKAKYQVKSSRRGGAKKAASSSSKKPSSSKTKVRPQVRAVARTQSQSCQVSKGRT